MKKLIYSSLAAALWGLWLLNPFHTTFSTGIAFSLMARIAPEEMWGTAVGLIGLTGLLAVGTQRLWLEMYVAIALFFLWMLLMLVYAFGAIQTTGVPIYFVLALLTADAYITARTQWLRGIVNDTVA